MPALLINKTQVRKYAGETNVSGDSYEALEEKVKELIDEGIQRAEANERSTLMARDL